MPSQNKPIEDLREMLGKLNGSGAHACHCPRSVDGGCDCALHDEYIDEIIKFIESYAAAERIAEWNQLEASDLDRAVKETVMHMYGRPRIAELQERITQ